MVSDKGLNSKFSRRGLMKKGSIAAAAVPFASKIVLGSGENMVKLPKFVSGGEPTEYFKAPKEWDEHRKQAKHVQEKINDQFGNAPNVIGLGLSQSKKTYGGKNGLKVTVRIDEEAERPPSELPEQVEGIPIATEAGLKGNLGGCSVSNGTENCVNKESDTTVNPGERINNGTAAMRMIDSNNDEYILTVAHLFESNCPNDVNGQTATTADGTKIGTVKYSNGVDDWAVVELNSDGNTSAVIDDNADFPTCVDSVSEAYLQEWESRWKSNRPCLYQMGCTTGKTSGRLKYANYTESDFNCGMCLPRGLDSRHSVSP